MRARLLAFITSILVLGCGKISGEPESFFVLSGVTCNGAPLKGDAAKDWTYPWGSTLEFTGQEELTLGGFGPSNNAQ